MQNVISYLFSVENYSVNTVFIIGLAVEFTGAVFLAKGTMIGASTILRRSWPVWGAHPGLIASYIEGMIDGVSGVAGILIGFIIQTVGYLLISYKNPSFIPGIGEIVPSVTIAISLAVLLVLIKLIAQKRAKRILAVKVARLYKSSEEDSRANLLYSIGNELGWKVDTSTKREGPEWQKFRNEYNMRVFKVTAKDLA